MRLLHAACELAADGEGGMTVEDQVKSMAYRQSIIDRLDRQTAGGIVEYGGTIDKSGHLTSAEEALEYLAEDLTDGLVYLEHLKALIRRMLGENQRLREELELSQAEIAVWKGWRDKLQARTIELFEREKKLVEALRWYADLKHHGHAPGRIEILHDQGQRARDTLKELGIE
jgi:hypothetical protein